MKFISKQPKSKTPHFWVEDYTEKERDFFISIGFKERKPNVDPVVAKAFKLKSTLEFEGSDIFTFWTKEEADKILIAIGKEFKLKKITIHQFIPD